MSGGFSPIDQFMDKATYDSVVKDMHLGSKYDDAVWPMPITLDVTSEVRQALCGF